jgi:hypothetical protein
MPTPARIGFSEHRFGRDELLRLRDRSGEYVQSRRVVGEAVRVEREPILDRLTCDENSNSRGRVPVSLTQTIRSRPRAPIVVSCVLM